MFDLVLSAWDEIFDVFGDGTDYDWALDDDDVAEKSFLSSNKPEMKYQDVCSICPIGYTYVQTADLTLGF